MAGEGQTSPITAASPQASSKKNGAVPNTVRSQGRRAAGSTGRAPRREGRRPAWARHTQDTTNTTGSSVNKAATIAARQPERSSATTAPNISAARRRSKATKTPNQVLRDEGIRHTKKTNAAKLTLPSTSC